MKPIVETVAVSGLSLMTGLGVNLQESWRGLIAGKSVTSPFRSPALANLPCPFGVELPTAADELFKSHIAKRKRSQMTRSTQISLVAADMAFEDAGLDIAAMDRTRIGIIIGTTGTAYIPEAGQSENMRILKNMSNSPASWISLNWKTHGPAFVVGTACSSAVYAMAMAHGLIVSGQCDVVLCGSMDSSINTQDIQGFCQLMALADGTAKPESASRPFDSLRSGFVIGEGGGFLVLESMQHAQARSARVYAKMHYPGLYAEGYNILSPAPDGEGMLRCMELALQHSGLEPNKIDYINAHGTSTLVNDYYETLAVKKLMGNNAYNTPISSTKSMTGHCLVGAGGVEAVISCKALYENSIPPTINLTSPDPQLDLDYVIGVAREKQLDHVMSNSFAFGGHNGVNIFSKYTP